MAYKNKKPDFHRYAYHKNVMSKPFASFFSYRCPLQIEELRHFL